MTRNGRGIDRRGINNRRDRFDLSFDLKTPGRGPAGIVEEGVSGLGKIAGLMDKLDIGTTDTAVAKCFDNDIVVGIEQARSDALESGRRIIEAGELSLEGGNKKDIDKLVDDARLMLFGVELQMEKAGITELNSKIESFKRSILDPSNLKDEKSVLKVMAEFIELEDALRSLMISKFTECLIR